MRRNILAVGFAVSLLSTSVFAAEGAGRDLTLSDLDSLGISVIHKVVPSAEGSIEETPDTKAALTGSIFTKCKSGFSVTAIPGDEKGRIGFTVTDLGGKKCQLEEMKGVACSTSEPCEKFHEAFGNATMLLADAPAGPLVLITQTTDELGDPVTLVNELSKLKGKANLAKHISKKQLAAEKAKAFKKRAEAKVRFYEGNFVACRGDEEEFIIAREAVDSLFALDPANRDFEKMISELDAAEFKILSKKVRKAPLEDLEGMRETLLDWASNHEGSETAVATELERLASRVVDDKDGTREVKLEDYRLAREILSEASDIDGITAGMKSKLKKDIQANQLGYITAIGMNGDMFTFNRLMNEQMQAVQKQMYQACYTGKRDMESCSAAQNSYRNMQAIPVQVNKINQQRQQEQQKMEAELAKLMGGSQPQQGNPLGQPGMNPMYNPAGYSTNNFNTGGVWAGGVSTRPSGF